jgi:acetyltransferase
MSLVGPNCFGVINTDPQVSLNATFSEGLPPAGNIGFVSQSGALCAGILAYGAAERIGFSRFVSVGNRAGVDECDLLRALAVDPATRVILLYVESLANGRRFLDAAREITAEKPVLVIKSGRTPAGERAARSHTGSLARSGRDRLFDALFEQSGVLRLDTLGELFRAAKIFGSGIALDGPRLAILTNSGGPGIVAADSAVRNGLRLPAFAAASQDELRRRLPAIAALSNPVDMTAGVRSEEYRDALQVLLADPEVDCALVIATPNGTATGEVVARAILDGRRNSGKAVVACLFGLTDLSKEMVLLEANGVPAFTFPEEAVQGLALLARYHAWRTRPVTEVRAFPVDRARVSAALAEGAGAGSGVLRGSTARALLSAYGISFPQTVRAGTLEDAVRAADALGYPVVLKVDSPDISHKTDVGGVAVGLGDASQLRSAWERMHHSLAVSAPAARIDGFDVEKQVTGGKEVLVGIQRDPEFGPLVAFGLGGIYVEVFQDVTFRLAPMRSRSAQRMIETTRAYPILTGVRGEKPSDLAALEEAIERVSQLALEVPEVAELDLNPLIVRPTGKGVVAVDARVILAPVERPR